MWFLPVLELIFQPVTWSETDAYWSPHCQHAPGIKKIKALSLICLTLLALWKTLKLSSDRYSLTFQCCCCCVSILHRILSCDGTLSKHQSIAEAHPLEATLFRLHFNLRQLWMASKYKNLLASSTTDRSFFCCCGMGAWIRDCLIMLNRKCIFSNSNFTAVQNATCTLYTQEAIFTETD